MTRKPSTALGGRVQGLTYAAITSIAVVASCAKAEDSPLADQGGDGDAGDGNGGNGGSSATGGSAGTTGGSSTGGSSTGGSAGRGGASSGGSSGKGGSTSSGGSAGASGSSSITYGCLGSGEGGEGGASGGAPGEAGAGGAGPSTLFLDDFDDGDADGWTPTSESWSVVVDGSGVYQQSDADSTSQYISAVTGTCWADQVVEARVKIVDWNGNSTSNAAGLFARYVSAQTHYFVGMNSGNNGELFIGKRAGSTSNAPERIAQQNDMDWETDTWYTLRLEVVGTSLKAYLDDTLMLETTDEQITSGGVAVGARHVNVRFDDVKVTAP